MLHDVDGFGRREARALGRRLKAVGLVDRYHRTRHDTPLAASARSAVGSVNRLAGRTAPTTSSCIATTLLPIRPHHRSSRGSRLYVTGMLTSQHQAEQCIQSTIHSHSLCQTLRRSTHRGYEGPGRRCQVAVKSEGATHGRWRKEVWVFKCCKIALE